MTTKTVPCPTCKAPAVLGRENSYRPFCSERCRLIDLGQWASEDYRVPVPPEDLESELPH